MRPRFDAPTTSAPVPHGATAEHLRDAQGVAELFIGIFRRDLVAFLPHLNCEDIAGAPTPRARLDGPGFSIRTDGSDGSTVVSMFGGRSRLARRDGKPVSPKDQQMIAAIGAVLSLRYYHLFQSSGAHRLELYRGGSEDHYIAAYVEPEAYSPPAPRPSRIAATVQTLRTAALSTYENHRVSTGALLLGREEPHEAAPLTPPDALAYGVELTGLKSVHRLCDGERTLFLVDRAGALAGIIDVACWAAERPQADDGLDVPCARTYAAHARATRFGGHVCLVLSPNQEIKLFTGGVQAFGFAHGRWRILDPAAKFEAWLRAVARPALARSIFQAALDLAEVRRGALFVVLDDPPSAVGRLIAPHDLLDDAPTGPPPELALASRDPLAKRALHYLARGRSATELAPAVLEALASLDGALVTDRSGHLVAFGAILRHDAADLPGLSVAEGARTTAALVASRFGPVLKVSEDGIVSCFLGGVRAWDL